MKLRLNLDTRILLLTVCVLPLLISLGFWQLGRAEEKRTIQSAFEAQKMRAPITWDEIESHTNLAFLPITLEGEFDTQHTLLLDNKIHEGRVGYQVLQPFKVQGADNQEHQQTVLINRGWVLAPPKRDELPVIPAVSPGVISITGEVYVQPGEAFILSEQDYKNIAWPLVIQNVEMKKISELLSVPLFEKEIRLAESDPNTLQINWQPISVQPEKHIAYAVQWFAMAIALVVWFVFANTNIWARLKNK